jgi:hypothetical protein
LADPTKLRFENSTNKKNTQASFYEGLAWLILQSSALKIGSFKKIKKKVL